MNQLLKEYHPLGDEPLPDGWSEIPVGSIALEIRSGFSSGKHNTEGIGIPHLRPMSVTPDGEVTLKDVRYVAPSAGDLRLNEGDLLFTNTSSTIWVGKTGVVKRPNDWAFSNHMTRIRLHEGLNPDFFAKQLHFLCRSGYFSHHCTEHVNQSSITPSLLRDRIPIRVPPIAEQGRIIEQLDKLEIGILAARKNLDGIPAQLLQTRQSLLTSAFAGTLTADFRKQSDWPRPKKVEDVCISTFYGPRFAANDYVKSGGIPTIRTTDFQDNGSINLDEAPRVNVPTERLDDFLLRHGDILVTRTGSIGKVAIFDLPKEAIHSAYLIRVRLTPEVLPRYVYHYLCSPLAQQKLREATTAFVQSNINASAIRNLPIPVPSIAEQKEIVARLDDQLESLRSSEKAHILIVKNLERLAYAVMARAFRGKLVRQDPNEEPILPYLKRITQNRAAMKKNSFAPKVRRPTESLRAIVEKMPMNKFTLTQLKEYILIDYDDFRDQIFELLEGPHPLIKQEFDPIEKRIQFVKI